MFVVLLLALPPLIIFLLSVITGYLVLSCIWITFTFNPEVRYIYSKGRSKRGGRNSKKKNLKEAFVSAGGLINSPPHNQPHIAIICVSDSKEWYPDLRKEHITMLLNHYKKTPNKAYMLYFCSEAKKFVEIIKSPNVTGVHIFGHGSIDGLTFQDDEKVEYREFEDIADVNRFPPKEFVDQFHCNHGHGMSLGVCIGKAYFVLKVKRGTHRNKKDIQLLIEGKLKRTPNPNPRILGRR